MTNLARRGGARLALLLAGLVVVATLAACGGSSATATPAASAAGIDGAWLLTGYVTPDGTSFTVPSAVTPTLTLDGDAASGSAGCNTFTAIVTLDDPEPGAIRFSQVASTNMPCEDPLATVEAAYLQALNLATTATVTGNDLVIAGPNNVPSLTFVRGS